MGVDPPREVGDGTELERAPKPPNLWDVMQAQVDRAFADFIGGEYPRRGARMPDHRTPDRATPDRGTPRDEASRCSPRG